MIQSLGALSHTNPTLFNKQGCVHFEFVHEARYLEEPAPVHLHILLLNLTSEHSLKNYAVLTTSDIQNRILDWQIDDLESLTDIADSLGTKPISLSEPLTLEPVFIAKPWGQEIWYSGIEARGVCTTSGVSIAWLLDVFGEYLGCNNDPILLKILDPYPDGELGNLYFEMHEEKIEVYIVTSVDKAAWPDGIGKIRYGFNQTLMQTYANTDAFLKDYVECVGRYREARVAIDSKLNEQKISEPPPTPEQYRRQLNRLDPSLIQLEEQRRAEMYAFTELNSIAPGDIITVEPLVPHSLQHGVRVVEFQTPHYERYILSFGQAVITQSDWDTAQVLARAKTHDVQFEQPESLATGRDLIADFSAFRAERHTLEPGESRTWNGDRYSLMIGVSGRTTVDAGGKSRQLEIEEAFFNPIGRPLELKNTGDVAAILLIAEEVGSIEKAD